MEIENEVGLVQEPRKFNLMDSPSSTFMNPAVYMQAKAIARDMMADRALPKGFETAGQAIMAMQAGAMMDMNWVEALGSLYMVNGALNIWGKAVPNRLRKHGYRFEYLEEDQTHCKARVWKEITDANTDQTNIDEEYVEDFKFSDAVKSGYTGGSQGTKIGWKEGINRTKKMRYNVLSLIISTYIPDVLGPVNGIVEVSMDYVESDPDARGRAKKQAAEQLIAEAKKRSEVTVIEADESAIDQARSMGIEINDDEKDQPTPDTTEDIKSPQNATSGANKTVLKATDSDLSKENDEIIEALKLAPEDMPVIDDGVDSVKALLTKEKELTEDAPETEQPTGKKALLDELI